MLDPLGHLVPCHLAGRAGRHLLLLAVDRAGAAAAAATILDAVTLFWFAVATSAVSLVGAIPDWVWPSAIDWLWLIVLGLLGGSPRSWSPGPGGWRRPRCWRPSTTPRSSWPSLFGYLWFKEEPSWTVWLGLPLVIGSGLYILHRERVRARERALAVA